MQSRFGVSRIPNIVELGERYRRPTLALGVHAKTAEAWQAGRVSAVLVGAREVSVKKKYKRNDNKNCVVRG